MERDSNTFTIEVDLLEGADKLELLVIPSIDEDSSTHENLSFMTVLDGVTFAVVKHDPDENWSMVEGALDQDAIDKIGEAIDNHYN